MDVSFGPYRLFAAQRLLLEGDKPVRLGSRAFDILTALVERAGRVVSKEELIARAWPTMVVDEANLKIQVSALRRALGDGHGHSRYVVNVVGRGYNFVAPVREEEPSRTAPSPAIAPVAPHNLPFATTRMIGREEAVTALVERLSRQRLVTIVGPGGIGKTTVALAVAEQVMPGYEDGVWLIDLTPLGDQRLVPSAVATVLGLEIRADDQVAALVARLKDKRMLLLLDNCEHVIDAAASLAAAIFSGAPGVSILATSRERLGIIGEREYRLGPLSSPNPSSILTVAEAETFSAVQLFVQRVSAIVEDFELTDANAPLVFEICRKLDGLPLAIEFAAPCVEALGVHGLADRLNDSLPLLTAQRRTSTARHQTMRAVINWSYDFLDDHVRRIFRALGIFSGSFTAEAATTVAMDAGTTSIDAIDVLADLVAKSLVVADVSGAKPRFRLLDTTRVYAIAKLNESGERERIARRHAEYYRDLFERAEGEAATRSTDEWLNDRAREIDNLRAALDWAFSPAGDGSIGVALTIAAFPLWMRLSLLEECRSRTKQAFGAPGTGATQNPREQMSPREQMRLYAALGVSTSNPSEMGAALTKTLEIARSLGDIEYQLRALRGLYFYHGGSSPYRAALPFAQTFYELTESGSDPSDRLLGERMIGVAKHFIGDQAGARQHLERVVSSYPPAGPGWEISPFQDIVRFGTLGVTAHVFLARVLWLQGFPDQAVCTAETGVEEARATGHALSFCYALTLAACQVALWTGNLAAADCYTELLLDHSRKHRLPLWNEIGARLRSVVDLKSDNFNSDPHLVPVGRDELLPRNFNVLIVLGEVAAALAHAGRIAEAGRQIDQGIELSEGDWLTPELYRLKGELLLARKTAGAAETAEQLFWQARDEARRQGALSWELRAATSFARLLRGQGRSADAVACLRPVYDRFTEGFGTADLIAAKQLLDELDAAATENR